MNKIFRIGRRVVNLLYYVISTHKQWFGIFDLTE